MDIQVEEFFPANEAEFDELFATEQACYAYLFKLRWPDGFRCPRCGEKQHLDKRTGAAHLLQLRIQPVAHGWHHFSQHQEASEAVVQGHVVHHNAEKRSERSYPSRPRSWQL